MASETDKTNENATNTALSAVITIRNEATKTDSQWDLGDIKTTERGLALLAALPANHQANAKQLADLLFIYQNSVEGLPKELMAPGGFEKLCAELKKNGGYLTEKSEPWMRAACDTFFGKYLQENGVYKGVKSSADVIGGLGDLGAGALEGLGMGWRTLEVLLRDAKERGDAVKPITKDQALSLAAVYEAAQYAQKSSPAAQAEKITPNIADKFIARVMSFFSWVGHLELVAALGNFFKNGIEGKGWSFSQAMAEAKAEKKPGRTYEEILEENMTKAQAPKQAAVSLDILRNVPEVAGVPTETAANIVASEGAFLGRDGKFYEKKAGQTTLKPIEGAGNVDLTLKDRRNKDLENIAGNDHGVLGNAGKLATAPLGYSPLLLVPAGVKGFTASLTQHMTPTPGTLVAKVHHYAQAPGFFEKMQPQSRVGQIIRAPFAFFEKWGIRGGYQVGEGAKGSGRFVQGMAEGASDVGTGSATARVAGTTFQNMGRWVGANVPKLAWATPVVAGGSTVADLHREDYVGAGIHGVETAATTGVLVKFGLKRFPIVGGIFSGGEFVNSAAHKDTRGMITHGTEFGGLAGGAAIGAGLGLAGGPFAPITVPGGAAVGALIGGLVGFGGSLYAGHVYDKRQAKKAEQHEELRDALSKLPENKPKRSVEADAGMTAAHNDTVQRTQQAQAQAKAGVVFGNASRTQLATIATVPNGDIGSLASAAPNATNRVVFRTPTTA